MRWTRKSPNLAKRPGGGGTEIIPPDGKMLSEYAKKAMNRKPTHQVGRLAWKTPIKGIALSSLPPADFAASSPIMLPTATTRSVPVVKRSMVFGKYAMIIFETRLDPSGAKMKYEFPNGNVNKWYICNPNLTGKGWLKLR